MNNKKTKRLLKEIKKEAKSPVQNGLIIWNQEDILHANALIEGPKDTPYQYGFYFFDFDFTTNYPFNPPKVLFKTTGISCPQKYNKQILHNCRFNPNLYETGKVCVSFLGTWAGPGWVSTMNAQSMFYTLQSLMNDNPIQNEPGFELERGHKSKLYNLLIKHANIRVAIINNLRNPYKNMSSETYEYMRDSFIKNYADIIRMCEEEKDCKYNKKKVKCPLYAWDEYVDFNFLKEELVKLYMDLC